ncbi:TPA: hypothetical protein DIS56_02660 [Candidatus Saccharibacteria bacterium]|nr:MAG: hypothetical protein UX30_C0006G0007 [Candidatus Saccharibacteria bacterium GW2011_GWA2_46_10]OGL36195.1 MAG: hypothetical protein A3F05_02745 [Candidatus Saccharibacteria bacterium RIFCSPHIGHO2_12_FULL_47_17]HCM52012.1 hypothetical protein [Candidatus Saccharibacteria bacterium]
MRPAFLREIRYQEEDAASHMPIEGAFPTILAGVASIVLGRHELEIVQTAERVAVEGAVGEVVVVGLEHWNPGSQGEFTDDELARELGGKIIQDWEETIARLEVEGLAHIDRLHSLPEEQPQAT